MMKKKDKGKNGVKALFRFWQHRYNPFSLLSSEGPSTFFIVAIDKLF